jgi:hypothetical protein
MRRKTDHQHFPSQGKGRKMVEWSFVIDTDSYAGNFEREMASFIVGRCDDYGTHRGGKYVDMFKEDYPNEDPFEGKYGSIVADRMTELGNSPGRSPVSIACADDSEEFESVEIFFDEEPTAKQLKVLKYRAQKFADTAKNRSGEPMCKILDCRLVRTETTINHITVKSLEEKDREVYRREREVEKVVTE